MTDKRTVLPLRFATEADDQANLPKYEAINYTGGQVDSQAGRKTELVKESAHISEKVYLFPESFNALRIELDTHWPNLFQLVGHPMASDAVRFLELMDDALDTRTTFDSHKVDAISKKYLDLLRARRGLSDLFTPGEKA